MLLFFFFDFKFIPQGNIDESDEYDADDDYIKRINRRNEKRNLKKKWVIERERERVRLKEQNICICFSVGVVFHFKL